MKFGAQGPVTFNRMNGIQEWKNGIMLFVNVGQKEG
jgi:hypothetical protein